MSAFDFDEVVVAAADEDMEEVEVVEVAEAELEEAVPEADADSRGPQLATTFPGVNAASSP